MVDRTVAQLEYLLADMMVYLMVGTKAHLMVVKLDHSEAERMVYSTVDLMAYLMAAL
jgi:hypothetical protein